MTRTALSMRDARSSALDRASTIARHVMVDAPSTSTSSFEPWRVAALEDWLTNAPGRVLTPTTDDAWISVNQSRIDAFAECTDDHQHIHAADAPGGAIAHGFLLLSLLTEATRRVSNLDWPLRQINYGLNRVRFVAPVPAGARVRVKSMIVRAVDPLPGGVGSHTEYEVHLEAERDARLLVLVARWLVRQYID